jgi:hypothetical protein
LTNDCALAKLCSDQAPDLCPPNTSPAFPRLIVSPENLSQDLDLMDLHLPDVVAIHLYKWNSEALRNFLDLRRGKVEYTLERSGYLTLLIAYLGQKIQVSAETVNTNSTHSPNYMLSRLNCTLMGTPTDLRRSHTCLA